MKPNQFNNGNHGSGVHGKWYVAASDDGMKYLHSDGVIRRGTVRPDGEYSGYFDTKEEAEAAIKAFERELSEAK